MVASQKVEEVISYCVARECICRWEQQGRAPMASPTYHRVCHKNCRQEKAKIPLQAAVNRRLMSCRVDFDSRFSNKKQFEDCQLGGGDT